MWFRNAFIYRLKQPLKLDAAEFEAKLQTQAFVPCGAHEASTAGWFSPAGQEGALTYSVPNAWFFALKEQERLLPAAVVNEIVTERAQEFEDKQGRAPGRKERQQLKEDITAELLPKAFTRSKLTACYIDLNRQLLVIDCPSATKAEVLSTLLRKTLGSLPILLPETQSSPAAVLTEWVKENKPPSGWETEDECELRDELEDGAIIRLRRVDLQCDEVQAHLESGLLVQRLAMNWSDRMRLVVGADLTLKRLKFLDVVQEEAESLGGDSFHEEVAATYTLLTAEIGQLVDELLPAMGGWVSAE